MTPRTLTSAYLGNLVCVEGIVTKCSLVRPKVSIVGIMLLWFTFLTKPKQLYITFNKFISIISSTSHDVEFF